MYILAASGSTQSLFLACRPAPNEHRGEPRGTCRSGDESDGGRWYCLVFLARFLFPGSLAREVRLRPEELRSLTAQERIYDGVVCRGTRGY